MQVIRPWLAIGRYRDTHDGQGLLARGIGALLTLAAPVAHPGIVSLHLPVEDGEPLDSALLRRGVGFVLSEQRAGRCVLIACGAGISRSTSFAIAALKEAEGLSLLEATQMVRRVHPDGLPHPALWDSLCAYYDEPLAYLTLLRAHEQPA